MEKLRKRNLLLTLIAFMLAVVSAVLVFMAVPYRSAKADEKEVVVKEKLLEEKIKNRENTLSEDEIRRIATKNSPSESIDYSAYHLITSGTITNLTGKILVVHSDVYELMLSGGFLGDLSGVDIYLYYNDAGVRFYYDSSNWNSLNESYLMPLESSVNELLNVDTAFWAYYIPEIVYFGSDLEVDMNDVVFNIDPSADEHAFFYGIPETSEPDPTEPSTGTSDNNPTETTSSGKGIITGFSDNVSSDSFIKIISVFGIFIFAGIVFSIVSSVRTRNRKIRK